jgi:citrate lyase synthetase
MNSLEVKPHIQVSSKICSTWLVTKHYISYYLICLILQSECLKRKIITSLVKVSYKQQGLYHICLGFTQNCFWLTAIHKIINISQMT